MWAKRKVLGITNRTLFPTYCPYLEDSQRPKEFDEKWEHIKVSFSCEFNSHFDFWIILFACKQQACWYNLFFQITREPSDDSHTRRLSLSRTNKLTRVNKQSQTHKHDLISTLPQLFSHKSIWIWDRAEQWASGKIKLPNYSEITQKAEQRVSVWRTQKQKQAPECLLVIQVAAEWHAEWDPIQAVNTMGPLWCESGSWVLYHWQHCPLDTGRQLPTGLRGRERWLNKSIGHLPLPVDMCEAENTLPTQVLEHANKHTLQTPQQF